jgi:hypothetical protein
VKFHLDFKPAESHSKIDHQSGIVLYGSCFSDNIGKMLEEHQFNALTNPEGLFFNPFSLAGSLASVINSSPVEMDLILKRDNIFVSYLHHSRVWDKDASSLAKQIAEKKKSVASFLARADYLILTFGTAFIYRHKSFDRVVANCQKQPAVLFEKSLLKIEDIMKIYSSLLSELKKFNQGLKIIFTVSPVKYLKDGVVQNTLSKATLSLAIDQIIRENTNCSYFPAYELVADDLRDYRFYKQDLAHPNEAAIEYIWNKFSDCYFTKETRERNNEIQKNIRRSGHLPLHT